MKNKIIKTAVLSTLVAASFTNAEEIKPEAGAELVIWTDTQTLEYMEYASSEFNKDLGYNVDFKLRGLSPMDSASRLIQDGGTTRVADVAEIEHDTLGTLVVAGGVMENLVNAERVNSEFLQSAQAASYFQGLTYGFPVSIATTALFYNKDLLPQEPKTFEELMKFAETFNDKQQNKYGFVWDIQNYYESRMFLALYGGYEFGKNGTDARDIGIASPEAQKGLAALKDVQRAQGFNPFDMRNPQVRRGLFAEGKVAAIVDGPWAVEQHVNAGINLGVVPMPTYDGQQPRTFSTVRLAVVSAYTEYPMAAQLFAEYLTTDKMLTKRFEMTQLIPPAQVVLDKVSKVASPESQAIIKQVTFSDAMPSIPEMGFIWSPMASAITALVVNDKEPEEVTEQAMSIIQEQIALQE
ncbi:maltose ABC transporter substrate-binding protein [uncultured Vibrio sp.]|uniref:sugar ABC transporter substrate-binding protein n=1 Tax=uncultured Vibrio sp. TaxID=114054 RepID=UPI00261FC7CD|nr:maltose ABC transporter substrate-binding protein [uncultured Vibrio sp.]